MSTREAYFALTKPRRLPLVLFSGLPALVLAARGWPPLDLLAAVVIGTLLAAGAANALNSYLERDLDQRMERTRLRPLPAGQLTPRGALLFGLALAILGIGTLWAATGPMAAGIALAAILVYVFAYTVWLKPRTPFAVIVGGVAGAIAPLIADAAVDGQVGAAGWTLFAIIFVWQPPHFYAIALHRRSDFEAAGVPMLHDRIGEDATRRRIIAWIIALVPVTLLPAGVSLLGPAYAVIAGGLGLWFLLEALRLQRHRDTAAARRVFLVSLVYLVGVFAAMIIDLAWARLV